MKEVAEQPVDLDITLPGRKQVSALLTRPADARACLVLAHGAGAGMRHPFMSRVASALTARHVATLRYQFPYMQQGSKRPDSPAVAQATVRAAVAEANRLTPELPLFAGGKSFGGRMTSQKQAEAPLPGVRGLVFLGFPLHPAGRPSIDRAAHLARIEITTLFLQGSRDDLADLALLRPVIDGLGHQAVLRIVEDADHSFHVPVRTGKTDHAVMAEIARVIANWIEARL